MKPRIIGIETEYGRIPDGRGPPIKEGRASFLRNGGRLYNDNGNVEYATPECSNPLDAVAYEKAGEIIVGRLGDGFIKNNVGYGNRRVLGCHENYSVSPMTFDDTLLWRILPFLVTRQVFAGAGRVYRDRYAISQKPFSLITHIGKRGVKSIVDGWKNNYSNTSKRIHVACGDSNMSEMATYMKVGTTSLVLDLAEDGLLPDLEVTNPLAAIRSVALDCTCRKPVNVKAGSIRTMPPLDVQHHYLRKAEAYRHRDGITDDILQKWGMILDGLGEDPAEMENEVEWVRKKSMLELYKEEEGVGWDDWSVKSIDLEYHRIDRARSIYYWLQENGYSQRVVSDAHIENAADNPPPDTRAFARGKIFSARARLPTDRCYVSFRWDGISAMHRAGGNLFLEMKDPFNTYVHYIGCMMKFLE